MAGAAAQFEGLAGFARHAGGIPQGVELFGVVRQREFGERAALCEDGERQLVVGEHQGRFLLEGGLFQERLLGERGGEQKERNDAHREEYITGVTSGTSSAA